MDDCRCAMCNSTWGRPDADMAADYPVHQYKRGDELLRKINNGLKDHRFDPATKLAWVTAMLEANERLWK